MVKVASGSGSLFSRRFCINLKNYPAVNGKYRVGSRKCTDRIENAKCGKKFFGFAA
jgi:hypothetical protein